ncbi:prophage endopeptidase tail family protein [Pediococcus pentosaceus]|uniref:prophage endopeptidase tail family protein n=1 Tax=Pediococcus pentosaceus TaxID=1255 RepID=UPI003D76F0A8
MLIVTDLAGNQAPLLVSDLHITKQLNEVEQLDFTTANIEENEQEYEMIQSRTLFTLPETGQTYRISQESGQSLTDYYQKTVTALQVIQDLDEHLIKTTIKGNQSLDAVMKFITAGTKFTYTIHDQVADHNFTDEIGKSRALDLFNESVINTFGVEYTATGYHIDLYKSIGKKNAFVFVNNDDIYELANSADYTPIRTYIYGEGPTDDNGKPKFTAEYISPKADVYGKIDTDLYSDDTAKDKNDLINKLKATLADSPEIQYTANLNRFSENNNIADKLNDLALGNYGYVRDRWGLDEELRIIQMDLYPQDDSKENTITFGNFLLNPTEMLADLRSNKSQAAKEINGLKSGQSSIENQILNGIETEDGGEIDG